MLTTSLVGCGRFYHLPGHDSRNVLESPPDITLRVGQQRKAISTGLTLMHPAPADIKSEDPEVVAVERPNRNTAYLRALKPGTTRVRYYPPRWSRSSYRKSEAEEERLHEIHEQREARLFEEQSFQVTVTPRQ